MTQSIETLFALADRKVEAFNFTIKKVKGKDTGNEFYAVTAECIINGEKFEKGGITIGCPKHAIEDIVKELLDAANANRVARGITLSSGSTVTAEGISSASGITLTPARNEVARGIYVANECCEDCDYEDCDCDCYDDEDDDDGYGCESVEIAPSSGPRRCPYCSSTVAPNFSFCPTCGGAQ